VISGESMPFGFSNFISGDATVGPVRGCVEASPCPAHHIAVHSTRGGFTYVYDKPSRNLLWTDEQDRERLNTILRGKRESRMGHEHSEDAITWNVFRFFERHERLASAYEDDLSLSRWRAGANSLLDDCTDSLTCVATALLQEMF
jgi:hypothetical protein